MNTKEELDNIEKNINRLSSMHIAIIGAGAAGLAAARHAIDPEYNCTIDVFEQTDELGGTWCYTDRVGDDEYGIPVHTSMYHGLVTNLPKEVMQFPDFKFTEQERSYLTQEEVLTYLQDYAKHYKLQKHVKFRHLVQKVEPLENNRWVITITDLCTRRQCQTEYDAILVCNGHYTKPILPDITGMDVFQGRQMHSHDYRRATDLHGQTVLIIGGGPSGMDISNQLGKHAAKVLLSRRKIELFSMPILPTIQLKPVVKNFTSNKAVFNDGTSMEIDAVIYCTGYEYYFPFLSKDCGITVTNNFVQPLYKHFINIEKPTMALIGLPFLVLPFSMFDFQIRLFLKYLKGKIQLPIKEEMVRDSEKDMNARLAKGYPKKYAHKLGPDFQGQYFEDLAKIAQVEPLPPVFLKVYFDAAGKANRKNIYKVIDKETFNKITQ